MMLCTAAPPLETPRLRLRPFIVKDGDATAAMLGDPEVMRHLGGALKAREDIWRKMLSLSGLWALLGYGYWAVERKEDGACIGQIGFADFKRDMQPSIEGLPEMGWIFARHAHGQGYAAEAARACLAWVDETGPGQEIVAIVNPANAPSIRLMDKLGFTGRGDALYRGEPILLFRRPALV